MYDHNTSHPLPMCGGDIYYMQTWVEKTGDGTLSFAVKADIEKKDFYRLGKSLDYAIHEAFSFPKLHLVKIDWDHKMYEVRTNRRDFSTFLRADYFVDEVLRMLQDIWEGHKHADSTTRG